jgi:hypothetical protein
VLPDSSGGTRLRRGGRRARGSQAWASTATYYCTACHVELHELVGGDWQVDEIGPDGDIAATRILPPYGCTATRAAITWLRTALADRAATWRDLVREASRAGLSEHTLRRARRLLGCRAVWRGRGGSVVCLWSLPAPGQTLVPTNRQRQRHARFAQPLRAVPEVG